jgi:hypothetical protein
MELSNAAFLMENSDGRCAVDYPDSSVYNLGTMGAAALSLRKR